MLRDLRSELVDAPQQRCRSRHYVGFEVGGYELGLLPDGDPVDGAMTYWGVDDVATAVSRAIAAGATEHTPAVEVSDGIITALVRTPQGALLGLIYNPHFTGA